MICMKMKSLKMRSKFSVVLVHENAAKGHGLYMATNKISEAVQTTQTWDYNRTFFKLEKICTCKAGTDMWTKVSVAEYPT